MARAELDIRVAGQVVTVPIENPAYAAYEGWRWLRAAGYPVAPTFRGFVLANARAAAKASLADLAVEGVRHG